MSGIQMMILGVGGSVSFDITLVGDTRISPNSASASVSFETNGTIAYTGNDSSGSPNWFAPTTDGIGNSYWVKFTVNSGTAPTSGSAIDTVLALSSSRTWSWSRSASGSTTANCTIAVFSDSGGTQLVHSDSFNVAVTVEV